MDDDWWYPHLSSILIGLSLLNHPAIGMPHNYGNPHRPKETWGTAEDLGPHLASPRAMTNSCKRNLAGRHAGHLLRAGGLWPTGPRMATIPEVSSSSWGYPKLAGWFVIGNLMKMRIFDDLEVARSFRKPTFRFNTTAVAIT